MGNKQVLKLGSKMLSDKTQNYISKENSRKAGEMSLLGKCLSLKLKGVNLDP